MHELAIQQRGASALTTLVSIVIVGYGIFIGFQYMPQYVESQSVGSILYSIRDTHRTDPFVSTFDVHEKVIELLQINNLNDLEKRFKVKKKEGSIIITFSYERELNLLYKKQTVHYHKSVRLNR